MFRNWKTTFAGVLGFLVSVGPVLPHVGHFGNADFTSIGLGISSMLLGALAKDHDKTGVIDPPIAINEHSTVV